MLAHFNDFRTKACRREEYCSEVGKKIIKNLKSNAAISSQLNSVKSSRQKNLSLEVRKNNNKFPGNECQILQFIKKAEYSY